jgi:AraC-like DNA-binding protein
MMLAGLDGLELKEATFVARSFPNHFHEALSIGIIDSGAERLSLGGASMIAHARTTVVIDPGEIHAHAAFDDAPWTYRVLYLSPDLVAHRRRRLGVPVHARFARRPIDAPALFRLVQAVHAPGDHRRDLAIFAVLDHLLRAYLEVAEPAATASVAMREAAELIRDRCAEKLRLAELGARFRMGPYQFVRAFRREHGLTPASFQMVHRVDRARRLLTKGARIVEAALDAGFYDQSHFVRYFTRYTGTTPSAYRKRCVER